MKKRSQEKRFRSSGGLFGPALTTIVAAMVGGYGFISQANGTVILSDNFSTSTLNATSTPSNGNTTSYDIASAKAATSSITTGDLNISQPSTSSAISEAQAIFTSSPVTLATVGDSIEFTYTFTDTTNLIANSNSPLYIGLFNSGGSAPKTDLQSTGLSSSKTTDASGGAAGWLGYVGQVFPSGSSSKVVTRPAQSGTTNTNQDLVSNDASGSQSYDNPAGAQVGSTGLSSATLTTGSQYTDDLLITLTAPGALSIANNLYSGTNTTGTAISSDTAATATATYLTSTFDGLAFGFRYSNTTTSAAAAIDVNSLIVQDSIASVSAPEPTSLSLLVLGGIGLMARRRRA